MGKGMDKIYLLEYYCLYVYVWDKVITQVFLSYNVNFFSLKKNLKIFPHLIEIN